LSAKALASVLGRAISTGLVNPHEPLTGAKLLELCDVAGNTPHGQGRAAEMNDHFSIHREARRTGEDIDIVYADVKRATERAVNSGGTFVMADFMTERAKRVVDSPATKANAAAAALAVSSGAGRVAVPTKAALLANQAIHDEAQRTGETPEVVAADVIRAAKRGGLDFALGSYLSSRADFVPDKAEVLT
jgi:hypothetical protein